MQDNYDEKTTTTITTKTKRIDPNDELQRVHDIAVASWLARFSYDNNDAKVDVDVDVVESSTSRPTSLPPAPPELVAAFRLGRVRASLGISVPIVWLANVACDFRGAYERRAVDLADDGEGEGGGEEDDDDDDDVDDDDGIIAMRMPRKFDPNEQLRFEALQLAYNRARRIEQRRRKDVDDVDDAGGGSFLVLSPRMIVDSRSCRRRMRDVLVRILECCDEEGGKMTRKAMLASSSSSSISSSPSFTDRVAPHPARRPRPQDACEELQTQRDGDVDLRREYSTTLMTSMMTSTSTSLTSTATTTTKTMARVVGGKKNGKSKGGKKRRARKQQHERAISESIIRPASPYDVRDQCEAGGRVKDDFWEGGWGHEHDRHVRRNDMGSLYCWCCDYCRVATFTTYQMAVDHERTCPAYLKLKEEEELESILNDICATNAKMTKNRTRGGRGGGSGMNNNTKKGKKKSKRREDEDNMTRTRAAEVGDKSCDKSLFIMDDDRESTSDSEESSSSSSPSMTTRGNGGHSPNEPRDCIQIEEEKENQEEEEEVVEWTHLPSKQSRKKQYPSLGVGVAKVVGSKCNDENRSAVTPSTTTTATTPREDVASSNGKKSSGRSRKERNTLNVTSPYSVRGITTPALSAEYGRTQNVAISASTPDNNKMTTKQDEVPDQSAHNTIITLTERNIAQKNMTVMKSSTIDYDDRVNDTALPQPYYDGDQSSTFVDKPTASIISTLPKNLPATALSTATAAAESHRSDDITTSSLLYQVSSLTSENETLTAQNNLLIKENEALLAKIAEAKRQSIEAVQHVHLKAYIAETARNAAEDRATRLENILLDLVSNVTVDQVLRREIQDAMSGNSSSPTSPVQSINSDTMRTRARASARGAPMPPDAPAEYFSHSSAADKATNPSPPKFERIFSRLRRGDHAA